MRTRAWPMVLAAMLSACAGPTLRVQADPADARVMIDGQRHGEGGASLKQPYYGTARIDALPARSAPPDPARRAGHFMVELPPPVTGWIFPFDLFVEIATQPWSERQNVVEVRAEPRTQLPSDEEPSTSELRARAMRVLTER